MYYCEYAHLLKKHMEHTCMSAIYYDQGSDVKVKQCKTIVTFDTIPESKILDASDLLILSNLQKPWTIACKDVSRVFEVEYSTYHILNRSELCECSLTAGNYLLSYTNINCGNAPEARDGYFTTYYSFNKIVLDVITEKFDIQVDDNTKTQAAPLHDDIPGYDLPTADFVQTSTDNDEDVSILEEDNFQIYVMHQQDRLLSCQLCPTFPPAWKELVELQGSKWVLFTKCNEWFGMKLQLSSLGLTQPIRGFPVIEPRMFQHKTRSVTLCSL